VAAEAAVTQKELVELAVEVMEAKQPFQLLVQLLVALTLAAVVVVTTIRVLLLVVQVLL
jgi:hypothetical protein